MTPRARLMAQTRRIAWQHGVCPGLVMRKCRKRPVTRARNACFAAQREMGRTLEMIGEFFDCDHSSVRHGLTRVAELQLHLFPTRGWVL